MKIKNASRHNLLIDFSISLYFMLIRFIICYLLLFIAGMAGSGKQLFQVYKKYRKISVYLFRYIQSYDTEIYNNPYKRMRFFYRFFHKYFSGSQTVLKKILSDIFYILSYNTLHFPNLSFET